MIRGHKKVILSFTEMTWLLSCCFLFHQFFHGDKSHKVIGNVDTTTDGLVLRFICIPRKWNGAIYSLSFLLDGVVGVSCRHEQLFDFQQSKYFFSKGIKLSFNQDLCINSTLSLAMPRVIADAPAFDSLLSRSKRASFSSFFYLC